MKILLLLASVYLAAVLDTTLVERLRIGPAAPDLLLLTAIVWLLAADGLPAVLGAGAIALLGDLLAPGRVGLGAFWMLPIGYALVSLRRRLRLEHLAARLAAVALAATAWAVAVALSARLTGQVALPPAALLGRAAATALYTAAVSLPVLMVLGWMGGSRVLRERELAEY